MHRCASGGRNGWRAIAETSNALRPLSPPGRGIRPAGDSRPGHGDPRQIERFRSRGFQGAGADLAGPARMPGAREPAEWKSPRSSYRHRRRKSALDETSNRGAQEAAVGPVPDPEPRGVVRFILRYRRRGSQRLDYCAAGGGPGKDPEPARRCRRSGISHCCRFSPFGRTRCVDRGPSAVEPPCTACSARGPLHNRCAPGRWRNPADPAGQRRPAVGFAPASGADGSTGPGGTAFTAFQKQGWTDSARRGTRVRSERFPGHRPLASGSRFRRFSFPFSGRRIASSPTN